MRRSGKKVRAEDPIPPKPKPMEEKKRLREEDDPQYMDIAKLEVDFRTNFLMIYCKSASEANEGRMNELRYIGMRYHNNVLVPCGITEGTYIYSDELKVVTMKELLELSSMLKKLK